MGIISLIFMADVYKRYVKVSKILNLIPDCAILNDYAIFS